MARRIKKTSPKQDGYRMPGEFEPQERVYMIWPERTDNWRGGAKPAQEAYANVAKAISRFTPVTMLVNRDQYANARARLPREIKVLEMSSNDAWCLYFPWDADDAIAEKICELEDIDSYRLDDFVLEGGSFHVDGEGTVLTTEMCLLSEGRNCHMSKSVIEAKLKEYLGCDKVLWLKDGIDPDETNGHVDDVACFVRPGEVACIYTENKSDPFYKVAQDNYKALCEMTDAKGRKLKVRKVCTPSKLVLLEGAETIDRVAGTVPRKNGEICIASYLNYLVTNNGVIVPQYDDENDKLALAQLKEIYPDKEVVGVKTREIVFGGGNIHCITQQLPAKILNK